jgi:hypothetical protein
VHLNIPEHGKAKYRTMHKIGWLVVAILAPEIVAYVAWQQNRAARDLSMEMVHIFPTKSTPRDPLLQRLSTRYPFYRKPQQHDDIHLPDWERSEEQPQKTDGSFQWTTTHSQYVMMGGFAFDSGSTMFLPNKERGMAWLPELRLRITVALPKLSFDFQVKNRLRARRRVTLTPKGLLYLAQFHRDLIPQISDQEIKDKSKADKFTKLLICVQASWFMVQCVARMVQRIPISLLELNTLAHATCALIIYCLWCKFNISSHLHIVTIQAKKLLCG